MRANLLEKAFKKTINETLKHSSTKLNHTNESKITDALTEIFFLNSTESLTKLEELDDLLSNERINLKDIRSTDYINEIFDSYIFKDKVSFVTKINNLIEERKKIKNELLNKLEKLRNENEEIQRINENKKEKFNNFIDSVYEFDK